MSQYSEGRVISMISDNDLSAIGADGLPTYQYNIVSFASSANNTTGRTIALTTSATDHLILGVLDNNPKAGETAAVIGRNADGTFKVRVSANSSGVAIGDYLTASSDSRAITTTTSGNEVFGRALEAGVAGQVIEYLPCNHLQQS
jgi:hypothetical protein